MLHLRKSKGLAGSMQFTYRNPDRSTDPNTALDGARSWVVAALGYPGAEVQDTPDAGGRPSGEIARYARRDYYSVLKEKLTPIAESLRAAGYRAEIVADTNKLVDRNVAWRAGIGWYGKNSNLLLPDAGSWFVLGIIATDAPLESTGRPLADGCGRCTRCIEGCPTGAIIAPGIVDATACIAWLVQGPGEIPVQYREAVGNRIYGCDECQIVCPPNRTEATAGGVDASDVDRGEVDILALLSLSDEEIEADYGRWYIAGRDMNVIRRTALVVLGNTATPASYGAETLMTLRRYLALDRPLLRAHAVWACRRLGLASVATMSRTDTDDAVRREWEGEIEARFEPSDWEGLIDG